MGKLFLSSEFAFFHASQFFFLDNIFKFDEKFRNSFAAVLSIHFRNFILRAAVVKWIERLSLME